MYERVILMASSIRPTTPQIIAIIINVNFIKPLTNKKRTAIADCLDHLQAGFTQLTMAAHFHWV